MQDERLVLLRLDQPREIRLLDRRIDVRVSMVLEDPEVTVQTDIDAGRLDHLRLKGVDSDPSGFDLSNDVTIGKQHVEQPINATPSNSHQRRLLDQAADLQPRGRRWSHFPLQ